MSRAVQANTHERVAQALRDLIRAGNWRAGQMLPGRRSLAQEHGVALATMDRAVTTLISEGLLRADDRRGTFVADGGAKLLMPLVETRTGGMASRRTLTGTIGIMAPILGTTVTASGQEHWPPQIVDACEHRLAAEPGLTIRFFNSHSEGKPAGASPSLAERLQAEPLDALIALTHIPTPEEVAPFLATRRPVVLAGLDPQETDLPQVYLDNLAGGALAARHLIGRGYQRLVYLQPVVRDWTQERLAGIRLGLAALGRRPEELSVTPPLPWPTDPLQEQRAVGREAGAALLAADWQPGTGIIAPNDWLALGFMGAAARRGLVAGRDYGLVGFDDRAREGELTSLRPPLAGLGETAADIMLALLRGEATPSRVVLRHRLIARSSSQPPAAPRPHHTQPV